jgi:formamidopyrimidine-DNA glycosylase
MPELPEVQTTVNGINRYAKGLRITNVWTDYKNNNDFHTGKDNIKNPEFFKNFKKEIIGKNIINAKRRAKNILINLSDKSSILIHMKMTGHVLFGEYTKKHSIWEPVNKQSPLGDPFNRHIRFVLSLSNGKHLVLADMRRFAKITHIHKNKHKESIHLKDIGPEPLEKDFTLDKFISRLKLRPSGKIKTVLLEPKIIAGIGNIYSDEILWRAGVHPERIVKDINDKEFTLMFKAMKETLQKGIDFGGDSMSDYRNILGERGKFQEQHKAYRKTGTKCGMKGCSGKIARKVVGARSAHFCNTHQK